MKECVKEQLVELDMAAVVPTRNNPRRIVADDPRVKELADSIEAHGLVHPVVCRPMPGGEGGKGKYELLVGRRRYEAHKLLGRATIQAIVRELDDKAALDVTVIENLQREDLDPMSEARGLKMLIDAGREPKEIAAQIGKGYVWVYRRLSLLRIIPELMALLDDVRDDVRLLDTWGALHLEVLGALPEDRQRDLVAKVGQYPLTSAFRQSTSVKELRTVLMEDCRQIAGARWDLDRPCLGKPACNGCLKRSDVTPELFHYENVSPEKVKKEAVCLDPECWEMKEKLVKVAKIEALRAKYGDALVVAGRLKAEELCLKADYSNSWEMSTSGVKQGSPGARPVVMLDRDDSVIKVTWAKLDQDNGADANKTPQPSLELRRHALVVKAVEKKLNKAQCPWVEMELAARYAAAFGLRGSNDSATPAQWKVVEEEPAVVMNEIWSGVKWVLLRRLRIWQVGGCRPQYEDAEKVAGLLGLDWAALNGAAEEQLPGKGKKAEGVKADSRPEGGKQKTGKKAAKVKKAAKGKKEKKGVSV